MYASKAKKALQAVFFFAVLCLILLPSPALAAPPKVICVPQVPSDLLIPHDTWSGEPTTLKGVAKGSSLAGGTYYWEFGDGNTSAPAVIINPDNLSVTHTYTADPGTLFVARLHVTDTAGESASDDYRIIIRNRSLDVEINKSVDDGLWWLYTNKEANTNYTIIPSTAFTDPGGSQGLQGEYFNNLTVSGTPALVRTDPNIDFTWGGSPVSGINPDFSVRWTGTIHIPADGMYKFASYNDDGTRLYIDGNQIINDWRGHGPTWIYSSTVYLTKGPHQFVVEFYDGCCGAQAKIYWGQVESYRWRNEGGSSYNDYYANTTASAVQAYEINGHLETGDPDENPYVDAVRKGIDYLMTTLTTYNMSTQTGGNPDSNGNGIGLSVNSGRPVYETGAVMDALVASGTPDAVARTGGANVLARRYQDIVQDMVDIYAWGMNDSVGGWQYGWNGGVDNSASQWGAIGMVAAEKHFGCVVPDWVKERNNGWLNTSYNGTGFGYTGSGNGWATTPSGMVQLAFDGYGTDDRRWQTAEAWLANNWSGFISNSRNNRYYSYYAFAKAMRLALPQEVTHLAATGFDWYGDETSGLARVLVDRQNPNGSWPYDGWPYVGVRTAAAWNVIILTRTLFEKPPVAIIQAEPDPGAVGQMISFDATGSYHVDPAKEIVEYLWDLDVSDGIDFDHPDAIGPVVEHAYGELGDYTAALKVVDNSTPSRFDITTHTIQITVPPHPPTAFVGGPYLSTEGETVQVDGSGSYDIDQPLGDRIVSWEWEADFTPPYDFGEASGQIASLPPFTGAGRHDIALRVTDNTATVFPTAATPDLTHVDYGEVMVYKTGVTDLYARPKATKCQLVWTHIDASVYEILRSETGPNSGFELIGTTTSTYSTYLDYNVVMYKDYWYRVRCEINGATTLSGPYHIYSAGRIRNRPPIITSSPLLDGQEQVPYVYDVQASDPEGTRLRYVLDSAPAGMGIDAATGHITWTPGLDQVGLNEVVVRVTDARSASASQFFQVVIAPRPNAKPVPDPGGPYSGLVGEALTFSGSAVDPEGDPIVQYRWVFGDGTETSGRTVTHAYPAQGAYIVTLYATDDRGATGSAEIRCQTGLANRPPIADAGGPYVGEVNQPITVNGSGSFDPDNDPLAYTWNSDTATGPLTGEQTSFTFDATGTYMVTLSIDDGRGGSDTATAQIVVTPPNEPPMSVFTVAPFLWNNLTFDGTGSSDPEGGALTAWEWNFGDGVTTTGAMVSHQYDVPGDYTVRLTVTDDKGATGFSEQVVSIVHPPNSNPDVDAGGPYTAPLNTEVTLTAAGADPDGDPVTFTWTHDSQDATGQTLALTFDTVGTYTASLTGDDGFGGTATDTATIVIFDPAESGSGGTPDETPPQLVISNPAGESLLEGMVTFTGSVSDDNLVLWVLEYAPAGTDQWETISTGTTNVDNDVLGQLDAGLIQDDLYRFRLRAQDHHYSVNTWIECEINSPLELGRFSLEYIDLEIPLAGIPIQIVRRYDTRDSNESGDFGYGWTLKAADPQIRETVPVQPMEDTLGFFVAKPYRMGTRVYLTNPDGERIGFTFEPTPSVSLLGTVFTPKFTPDPGVQDQLEVDPINLTYKGDGTFVFFLLGFNYNPSDFRLKRKDGTIYHYSQFNGLDKIADRNSNELTYTYNGIFHSSGKSISFDRDTAGRITKVIDPEGNEINYAYNTAGDLELVTDQAGLTSTYGYFADPVHYLETINDSLGNQAARYEYDSEGRLTAFINAKGDRAEQSYDPAAFSGTFTDINGHVTDIYYDARGNIIREVNPLGEETSFTWDGDNNKTSETDENGNTTQYTYDDRGNVLSKTDATGHVTTFTYNTFNQITRVTDSSGRSTVAVFDDQGNLMQFTNPAGQTAGFTYLPDGRIETLTDFSGHVTTYEYTDDIAHPTRIINPDGTSRTFTYLWTGQVVDMTDENGGRWLRTYDHIGRLKTITDPLGHTTGYGYTGHLQTSKTCALGYATTYGYNEANLMISQTDHLGNTTTFEYDAAGNRTAIIDPVGNTTSFVFDELNRLIEKIDPLNMRTSYAYDPAGNLAELVDRNNRRRTFDYDALNRMVRETWFDGAATVNVINYGHDTAGNQTYVADQFSSLYFSYDNAGQVLTVDNTGTPGVPAVTLTYGYDPMGNRISVEDSLGVRAESVYGSQRRLLSRTWQGTGMADPVRVNFGYNPRGNINMVDRFTNTSGLYPVSSSALIYDAGSRLTDLTHDVINGGTTTVADYEYTYNAPGLLISETHHGQTFGYHYDLTGQLTGSTRSVFGPEDFVYDANGSRTGAGYTVGAGNRILSDSDYTYGYDAEGNITTRTDSATGMVTAFGYDHRNRLVRIEKRDAADNLLSTISYTYDGLDRRISTSVNGQVTTTVYDGDNAWADFNTAADVETRYMFGDGPDSLIARSRPTGETDWYLADRLGTVRDIVDSDGNLLNHIDYDSFGGVFSQTDAAQGDRFLFTGREFSEATGLYYYRNRYYDPGLGRFISEDPMGFDAGDFNLYRYVNNSPLNGTDPTGEQTIVQSALIFACSSIKAVQAADAQIKIWLPPLLAVRDVLSTGTFTPYTPPTAADMATDAVFDHLPSSPCGLPTPVIDQYKDLVKWALNNIWFPRR